MNTPLKSYFGNLNDLELWREAYICNEKNRDWMLVLFNYLKVTITAERNSTNCRPKRKLFVQFTCAN